MNDINQNKLSEFMRVRINISGRYFETYRAVLHRFPDTLLGNDEKLNKFWDINRNEFYFDHSPVCFEGIFAYYQTGRLRKPMYVHNTSFLEAIEFFELGDDILQQFRKKYGILEEETFEDANGNFKLELWNLFEYPHSSRGAKILSMFSIALIILSVFVFCVETMPDYKRPECLTYTRFNGTDFYEVELPNMESEFFFIECACVSWFAIEFLVRFITCPKKLKFIKTLMNLVDVLSILPIFVTLGIDLSLQSCWASKKGGGFLVLRILRIFRIFKLSRFSQGLRIWKVALTESFRELCLILFMLIMGGCISAAVLYYAEYDYPGTQITSLLEGYWWGVATMTTVGYGDIVPKSPWGKVIAIGCIMGGTLGLALPAPIIVSNFNRYYKNVTGRGFHGSDWE